MNDDNRGEGCCRHEKERERERGGCQKMLVEEGGKVDR